MPKELPGFYYDETKNRYFPYKGPIRGSSAAKPPPPLPPQPKQVDRSCGCIKVKPRELLQARELFGNIIISRRGKINFQAEYWKRHAMQPVIWKYRKTKKMASISLEHAVANVILPHGLVERDVLLSGGVNSMIRLYQIGNGEHGIDPTKIYEAYRVLPHNIDQIPRSKELLQQLGSFNGVMLLKSDISCIKVSRKPSRQIDYSASKHFVVTTLGSDYAPGSVYVLDLSKPLLDTCAGLSADATAFCELATFNKTIWTADSDPEGRHVAIGTNSGAALVNMDNGAHSWVLRCRSDVLSVEFDQSGNNVLCGMRNGAVVIVDTRRKPIKWSKHNSSTISLNSSICCLRSLKLTDQYFVASSMDGSMKLYDQRLIQKGPIQSYEGNVNSHSRIELGVDPSEKIVMSGGEDCYLRMWDIKSGNMLFEEKFMQSIPSAICWPRTEDFRGRPDYKCYRDDRYFGAWLGSYEGIFYMDWL